MSLKMEKMVVSTTKKAHYRKFFNRIQKRKKSKYSSKNQAGTFRENVKENWEKKNCKITQSQC